jgi:ABC-2 type transport system permease protein
VNPVVAGLGRGGIELRQTLTNAQDMWNYVFRPTVFLVVMYFLRGKTVPGTDFSLGAMSIPSVVGMQVAFGGLVVPAAVLIIEREDGTLLRAKATPNGMLGYLVGKIVRVLGMTLVTLAIILVPGMLLFDGLRLGSSGSWLTLAWVLLLGLVATMPIGAVLGPLFPASAAWGSSWCR